MTTKYATLKRLVEQAGEYVTGPSIASELSVGKGSIWKAVEQLRREGHLIDDVSNKGYVLSLKSDVLSPDSLP